MKKVIALVMAGMLVLCLAGFAVAAPKDDAVALVKKAVAHVKESGKEKALADFNDPKGKFVKGALYIFAYNLKGVIIAHPMNPKLIGKDMNEVKDADGKYFTKDFLAAVNGPGKGWVDYRWTNPVSKKIEAKSSYVEKAGDMLVGCGIYK
ncbi:MAG: cache domain-containing protein [Desulfuromonadaceae bacterium]|nr:cache domain-containing protein [Desulfuromonadaceae bacterium]MDD5107069.1 cache domain-containing protein [Desulfuromonadaceae bacterium]